MGVSHHGASLDLVFTALPLRRKPIRINYTAGHTERRYALTVQPRAPPYRHTRMDQHLSLSRGLRRERQRQLPEAQKGFPGPPRPPPAGPRPVTGCGNSPPRPQRLTDRAHPRPPGAAPSARPTAGGPGPRGPRARPRCRAAPHSPAREGSGVSGRPSPPPPRTGPLPSAGAAQNGGCGPPQRPGRAAGRTISTGGERLWRSATGRGDRTRPRLRFSDACRQSRGLCSRNGGGGDWWKEHPPLRAPPTDGTGGTALTAPARSALRARELPGRGGAASRGAGRDSPHTCTRTSGREVPLRPSSP